MSQYSYFGDTFKKCHLYRVFQIKTLKIKYLFLPVEKNQMIFWGDFRGKGISLKSFNLPKISFTFGHFDVEHPVFQYIPHNVEK